jgi:hypothetical protein
VLATSSFLTRRAPSHQLPPASLGGSKRCLSQPTATLYLRGQNTFSVAETEPQQFPSWSRNLNFALIYAIRKRSKPVPEPHNYRGTGTALKLCVALQHCFWFIDLACRVAQESFCHLWCWIPNSHYYGLYSTVPVFIKPSVGIFIYFTYLSNFIT